MRVNRDHMQQYVDAWAEMDPAATGYVDAHKIEQLLRALDEPMGLKGVRTDPKIKTFHMVAQAPVPVIGGTSRPRRPAPSHSHSSRHVLVYKCRSGRSPPRSVKGAAAQRWAQLPAAPRSSAQLCAAPRRAAQLTAAVIVLSPSHTCL